jgi:uncharacterized protein YecT (DUF1311 family)
MPQSLNVSPRMFIRLGIAMGVLLLISCAPKPEAQTEQTQLQWLPMNWTPALEQVQDDLEENLAARPNQSQQALNRASQNLADLVDARLFIAYVQLQQRLGAQGREALFTEQEKWLVERAASARAAVESKGGSLANLEHANAFAEITKKRLAELEERLAQQSVPPQITPAKKE